jgi:hypothetical protein
MNALAYVKLQLLHHQLEESVITSTLELFLFLLQFLLKLKRLREKPFWQLKLQLLGASLQARFQTLARSTSQPLSCEKSEAEL